MFRQRVNTELGPKFVGQTMEVQLARHLKADDSWDPIEVLTTLDFDTVTRSDADVEVLTNRT